MSRCLRSMHVALKLGQPQINLLPVGLLPDGHVPTGTKTIGARTEHIEITTQKDGVAEVDWIEHLGDQNRLHMKLEGRRITTLVEPDSKLKTGDRVGLRLVTPLYFDGARMRIG